MSESVPTVFVVNDEPAVSRATAQMPRAVGSRVETSYSTEVSSTVTRVTTAVWCSRLPGER